MRVVSAAGTKTWRRGSLFSPAVLIPLGVFALTRLVFLVLTYFGVILFQSPFPHPPMTGPQISFLHSLLPSWNQWDARWYVAISQRGYGWKNPAGTSPSAFFPLFPLLIHVGVAVTHRSAQIVALTLSNLAYLAALLYLWRLAAWEFSREVATRTVIYLSVFPSALFTFAGYTESLFLFLSVACLYYLRRDRWILAGVLGGLASATRVGGVLLTLPFLYQYARAHNFSPRHMLRPGLAGLVLIPAGLAAFMAYLHQAVGDPLAFSHGQVGWQKIVTPWLGAGVFETVRQLVIQPGASFFQAHNLLQLAVFVVFIAATVFMARRLPVPYTIYTVAFWILTLASPAMAGGYPVPFVSLWRYVLALFPVFLTFGLLGRSERFHTSYLVICTALLSLFTLLFVNGRWVV